MPPRRSRRVQPTPAAHADSLHQPTVPDVFQVNGDFSAPQPGQIQVQTVQQIVSEAPPAPRQRRSRKRVALPDEHKVSPARRRCPTATVTQTTEHATPLIPVPDVLETAGMPGVDAIADAVFARMRDAGLLQPQAPRVQPQAPAVVDAQPEPPSQPAVEGALGSGHDKHFC